MKRGPGHQSNALRQLGRGGGGGFLPQKDLEKTHTRHPQLALPWGGKGDKILPR